MELVGSGSDTFRDLFNIEDEIGRGNFGKVYACTEVGKLLGNGDLCVKVLLTNNSRKTDERDVMIKLHDLDHPNIVRCHRFISTNEAHHIVMDRCRGPNLADHLEEYGTFLSVNRVRLLGRQILGALAAMHSMGIMHRDVKIENLRFSDTKCQTLKLLDFGFAKLGTSEAARHTVTGTLLYTAPEVFDGVYGSACDVWSAGVLLYILFAGHAPFDSSDILIMRSMHRDPVLTGDSMFRGERWRQVSGCGHDLIRSLLTVDAAARCTAETALRHNWFAERNHITLEGRPSKMPLRDQSVSSLVRVKRRCSLRDLVEKTSTNS